MATFVPSNSKTAPQVVDHTPDHMTLITEEQQVDGGIEKSSGSVEDDSSDCSSNGENDYDDYEMTEV